MTIINFDQFRSTLRQEYWECNNRDCYHLNLAEYNQCECCKEFDNSCTPIFKLPSKTKLHFSPDNNNSNLSVLK